MPERDDANPSSSADAADTKLLVHSVREAGKIARKFFGGTYKHWDKGRGNPVTEADIAIDRQLRQVLCDARPDYGWLSEESEDDSARLLRPRIFVVDPIDGTVGFLKGRPHFTIVAAVVSDGRPVSGAIYNPISGEMYEAAYGCGARLNGEPLRVTDKAALDDAQILAPRITFAPENWTQPWPASMKIETRSSIAYRMALVAAGKFDAALSLSAKYDWDLAAGDIIVHEAGGRATGPDGALLVYNRPVPMQHGVVCAGPRLHKMLLERIENHRVFKS